MRALPGRPALVATRSDLEFSGRPRTSCPRSAAAVGAVRLTFSTCEHQVVRYPGPVDPLEQIVELRRLAASLGDPEQRRRLARVVRALRASLPSGIPKRRAARLLGISPQALERWVRAGEVPTVRRPGSSRELVDRDALVRLLEETARLRDQGQGRPVAGAVGALRDDGALRRRPRPNQSVAELRRDRCDWSSAERLRAGAKLSRAALRLAAAARPGRRGP